MKEETLSLYELNALVRRGLEQCLPDAYWIQAETSDVRCNANGHCYLEFVQKDGRSNQLIAKARGMIWNNVFAMLRPYFEEETGQSFTTGIKVLVQVTIQFHELYGYSLNVVDIDPTYTLGDMARRRREIINQLEEEGVLTLNKELEMPLLPQRIAVISSATAAGYGDFCNQLEENGSQYGFKVELFAAVMQGHQAEQSILSALDKIHSRINQFDVVVIIRGGGATSELSCFDSYLLAAACAQFDLPIIVGIGHERDETVLDVVAHTRVKTPTAAAEYIVNRMDEAAAQLNYLANRLREGVMQRIADEHLRLNRYKHRLPSQVVRKISEAQSRLGMSRSNLERSLTSLLMKQRHRLELSSQRIDDVATNRLRRERILLERITSTIEKRAGATVSREVHKLELLKQHLLDASPDKLLEKGYSITLKDGKVVKEASQLKEGDEVTTRLWKGEFTSTVTNKTKR